MCHTALIKVTGSKFANEKFMTLPLILVIFQDYKSIVTPVIGNFGEVDPSKMDFNKKEVFIPVL